MKKRLWFAAIAASAVLVSFTACAPAKLPSLAKKYQKYFKIGTCVELDQISGSQGDLVLRQFNSITAENAMKPVSVSRSEGKYNFGTADKMAEFAQKNKMVMRGHTLVWHQQNAKWMFYDDANNFVSKDVLLKRLQDYITAVVSRYQGKIYAWDVVNEVVTSTGMRESEWYQISGEEYIEKAFEYAHAADPDALLFINDYDTAEKMKRDTLHDLIKRLLAKGVPIHGVGLQYHISLEYPSLQEIKDELDTFSDLGIQIHITELDMSMNSDPKLSAVAAPEDMLIRQAHRYKEIFELFKQYKSITSVTFWGFQDSRSWLNYSPVVKPDWPLLFDNKLQPKLSFWALMKPSKLPKDVVVQGKKGNKFTGYASRGTPKIDAVEDEAWGKATGMDISILVQGDGSTGVGKALWDDENLYVFVKVKDTTISNKSPNAYEHDSVEIFVDEKNDKATSYGDDDAQYRLDYNNEFSFRGNPAKYVSAAKLVDGGYAVEIKIPFRSLKPVKGAAIGFDLQINDDSGGGTRTSLSKWNDPTNESFRNTSGFGTLMLAD